MHGGGDEDLRISLIIHDSCALFTWRDDKRSIGRQYFFAFGSVDKKVGKKNARAPDLEGKG